MILELARTLALDLESSWMVGDSQSDITAGTAAGCRTALVADPETRGQADLVARSLWELSGLIAGPPTSTCV
jgi:D-glycero-D-manno-heptose 1,7-bisphosphate phosphatase